MSGAQQALNNVRYFLSELLPMAAVDCTWTPESVCRAMRWAAYCEQAAVSAGGQPPDRPLRRLVHKLLAHRGSSYVGDQLQLLRQARRELVRRLLQNGQLSEEATRAVLDELSERPDELLAELAAEKRAYLSAMQLVQRRRPLRRRMEALTLYKYLANELAVSGRIEWVRSKISSVLSETDGPLLVVTALTTAGGAAVVDTCLKQALCDRLHADVSGSDVLPGQLTGWWLLQLPEDSVRRLAVLEPVKTAMCDACTAALSSLRTHTMSVLAVQASCRDGAEEQLLRVASVVAEADGLGAARRRLIRGLDAIPACRRWRARLCRVKPKFTLQLFERPDESVDCEQNSVKRTRVDGAFSNV